MSTAHQHLCVLLATLLAHAALAGGIFAAPPRSGTADFGVLDELGVTDPLGQLSGGEEIKVSAQFTSTGDGKGRLEVTAELAPQWHIYSLKQPPGGPSRTEIVLDRASDYQLVGPFEPDSPPHIRVTDIYDPPLSLEEHEKRVVWAAPLEFRAGTDPATLVIRGKLVGQVCRDGGACIPLSQLQPTFEARLVAVSDDRGAPPSAAAGGIPAVDTSPDAYRSPGAHITWQGWIEPATTSPGSTVELTLTATPDTDYHIYAQSQTDLADTIAKETLLGLENRWTILSVEPDHAPVEHELFPGEVQIYHEKPVTWRFQVKVPEDALATVNLRGSIGYQTCTDKSCDQPTGLLWSTELTITPQTSPSNARTLLRFSDGNYRTATQQARETLWSNISTATTPTTPPVSVQTSRPSAERISESPQEAQRITAPAGQGEIKPKELISNLFFGLLGGVILNLMPCVLPVIGLKVLSFVEQAGENRWRIFWLNLVYAFGIISVFMILATLVAFARLSWGEQYNNPQFVIAMIALVFVMALSFLGVWEIPIPGFSSRTSQLESREGLQGAFFKGVITTILATPCSGPYLGAVLAYVLGKPAYVSYLIFGSVGLGMSLPYLIIGAQPQLVRHLPKPGLWMESFKQFLGFILLAAVIYLFTTLSTKFFIPTLAFLFSLWFACWWVGHIPITASSERRMRGWLGAVVASMVLGYFSFSVLGDHSEISDDKVFLKSQRFVAVKDKKIAWRAYSDQLLHEALAAGKTVMVEFTANWCLTCKYNLKTAIETAPVRDLLESNQVVPLLADWNESNNDEIKQALARLNSVSVPLLAIYPARQPDQPIVLRDTITRTQLIEGLTQAGPSLGAEGESR